MHFFENGSASDAFRDAYDTTTTRKATVHDSASRLLKRPAVIARIDQLKSDRIARMQLTADSLLLTAKIIQERALEGEKFGDATGALKLLMEKCGLFDEVGEKLDKSSIIFSANDQRLIAKFRKELDTDADTDTDTDADADTA